MKKHIVALAAAILAVACASLPVKQRAVVSLQSAHAALASADDIEQRLYESGLVKALDAAAHRRISEQFVRAYDLDARAAGALAAWRAGDPPPRELSEFLGVAREVAAAVAQLSDGRVAELSSQVSAWVGRVEDVMALIGR